MSPPKQNRRHSKRNSSALPISLDSQADNINLHSTNETDVINPNKINLSLEAERKLQKIPSFSIKPSLTKDDPLSKYSDYKPLKLYNIPFYFWFIGIVFLTLGIILTINIVYADNPTKRIFDSFYGKSVWEYIILVVIYVIGCSFFIVAKYETIVIDKQKGMMTLSKFYLIKCERKLLEIPIEQINSIFPTQVVTESAATSRSCLKKIGIRFNENSTVFVFKTIFTYGLIKRIIKLRAYVFKKICTYDAVKVELKGTETYHNIMQH